MKTLKTILLGITAATLIAGCDSGGGSSGGGTKPPVNNPPVINSVVCPAEINEGEQGVCQVNAYDSEGSLLSYSADIDWINNFSDSGEGTITAPEVPSNTNYDLEFEVCDDKNACTTASTSILVKNVEEPPIDPPEENVLPVIQGLVLSGTASADASNIYQTWGKNIDGRVFATDANQDPIIYNTDVSSDALCLNSALGDEFSIATTQQTSTDATADLGQVVFEACDDLGCDTKTFKAVGKNPIQANIYPTYYEDGKVKWYSDATGDGSLLDKVEIYFNDVYIDYMDVNDTTGWVWVRGNIIDGLNTGKFPWTDYEGNTRTVSEGFTPDSKQDLLNAIDNELTARGISWEEDVPASVSPLAGVCSVSGYHWMYAERYFQKDDKNYLIAVADFSNPTDVTDVKENSLYFNCGDELDNKNQFFIGNPTSSVPKIMEDYLGPKP